MSKILITGGSGFIGSNLVSYLLDKDHDVLNFDIKEPRNKRLINKWIKGDILDKSNLSNFVHSMAHVG